MPIARLPTDEEAVAKGFQGYQCQRRRDVLRETLSAFETSAFPSQHHARAELNLSRWRENATSAVGPMQILVMPGDWGDVALEVTERFGTRFAVLNMANAYYPGGAYGEGAVAQEENMFRRTDCHFRIRSDELNLDGRAYRPDVTRLLSGVDGLVYLDIATPRVCIRGAEDRSSPDLGYVWLPPDRAFQFFELRAAAQDLRDGRAFDIENARHRIAAQLDTLIANGIKHAVLGAFGCGAFGNPDNVVARIYREELAKRASHFQVVAFAIFSAGYGPDNFTPFAAELARQARP